MPTKREIFLELLTAYRAACDYCTYENATSENDIAERNAETEGECQNWVSRYDAANREP